MSLPEPQTRTFANLVAEIDKGQIKIPQFQRDFVWSMQKSAALIDSILKGYPIGTFIFWRTKERLRSIRNIGDQSLPNIDESESLLYVLDGQQRLTSLYACLRGVKVKREDGKHDDFSKIHIDLTASNNDQIVKIEIGDLLKEKKAISVLDLLVGDFQLLGSYPSDYHDNIKLYKNRIESYQYSIIQIKEAPIDIATEIFTRINVSGKSLSLFEIMVAKTYDHKQKFSLADEFELLIQRLQPLNFETLSNATVLQTLALILRKECKRQVILQLDRQQFIETWPAAVDAIERAVEYFRNFYRIPVSNLLPYNALVAAFAYFFYHHKDRPTGKKQQYLQDFFWRCALVGRYSSSAETKLAQDVVERIDLILKDQLPNYEQGVDLKLEFLTKNGSFNTGRSYVKAILCLYAYMKPESFVDRSIVNISNNWLKQANSKNYHHFFTKKFLRDQKIDLKHANNVFNITIVDDFLNKRLIGSKSPSKYMKMFAEKNNELAETMRTHLIDDLEGFGVWDDDYDTFLKCRAKAVRKLLKDRIITSSADKQGQTPFEDDYEGDPASME